MYELNQIIIFQRSTD